MNGLTMSVEYGQSSVVSREHPPVFRAKKLAPASGIFPRGLVLSEKFDADKNIVGIPFAKETGIALVGTIDGTNKTFTLVGTGPIEPGTVVVSNDNATAQSLSDNGFGVLSGDGSGKVDNKTGDLTVTFTTAPASGKTVTAAFTRKVCGPLVNDVDTSRDTLGITLAHGIAVGSAVVIDKTGTAVTDEVAGYLEKLPGGVWLQ
jgi:hypothetical protein